jgi:hypothetical protein
MAASPNSRARKRANAFSKSCRAARRRDATVFGLASTISAISTAVISSISARTNTSRLSSSSPASRPSKMRTASTRSSEAAGPLSRSAWQGLHLGHILAGPVAGFALVGSPVVPHHMHKDLEHPGLELRASLEFGQPAVHDHEDVLHDIVDVGRAHPHAAHGSPHEFHLLFVDRVEVQHRAHHASRRRWRNRGQARQGISC